jgi:hypothetical protein
MKADSKALTTFFRYQGIYLCLALVVGAIFWSIGLPINPFTVLLYSLCIGNFLSLPMQWLHALYEKPAPYDWIIFLVLLCIVTVPVNHGVTFRKQAEWWLNHAQTRKRRPIKPATALGFCQQSRCTGIGGNDDESGRLTQDG